MTILKLYEYLTRKAAPLLQRLLQRRMDKGKEDPGRISERQGRASRQRPEGKLIWLHAASVGEAQSSLVLIETVLAAFPDIHFLVTTGTRSSAKTISAKLPDRAFHQFFPVDHPGWVNQFLDYWQPDFILWMESELWPNMLLAIKNRGIPAVLVNARLSKRSFRRWRLLPRSAQNLLGCFSLIMAQTAEDAAYFESLNAGHIIVSGNLKYSAAPLPVNEQDLKELSAHLMNRPLWVYASTHKGEEMLAVQTHEILKNAVPDLITVIIPRHPERRHKIAAMLDEKAIDYVLRGKDKKLPGQDTQIYIADTMGELGLFYRLAPIVCIGRSFSDDGGGGHNPLEAAQLQCAILHGPHVQFQKEIYEDLAYAGAALEVSHKDKLHSAVWDLMNNQDMRETMQKNALHFTQERAGVIHIVMDALTPMMERAGIGASKL